MRFGNTIDLSRWAVVSYNDDSGLGRQATDMRKVLGVGHFFALPSIKLETKPLRDDREHMLPGDASEADLSRLLAGIQGIFMLERLTHHLPLVQVAKRMGVFVACVPNWEHFAGWLSLQNQCDLFLCPSGMTHTVLRGFGFRNAIQVPCPVDLDLFPSRAIQGPAKLFIHNSGVVNPDDRKSVREVIEAFKRVPRKDIRLRVRLQKPTELPALDSRIEVVVGNLAQPSELYEAGDVAIQPSKLEGIGFTVLEAALSGLPVITTNYPPMNEVVRDKELLCKVGWRFHKVRTTRSIYHAHLRKPDIQDLAEKIQWCAENDMRPFSDRNRALREAVFAPHKVREKWLNALQAQADGRLKEVMPPNAFSACDPIFFFTSRFFRTARAVLEWRKMRAAPTGETITPKGSVEGNRASPVGSSLQTPKTTAGSTPMKTGRENGNLPSSKNLRQE